jgi:hypothetical protein
MQLVFLRLLRLFAAKLLHPILKRRRFRSCWPRKGAKDAKKKGLRVLAFFAASRRGVRQSSIQELSRQAAKEQPVAAAANAARIFAPLAPFCGPKLFESGPGLPPWK